MIPSRRLSRLNGFATYAAHAGGNRETAAQLYTWNTAVSAAFYGPLQACEVALRNAINDRLSGAYGGMWFDNTNLLRGGELRMAVEARERLTRIGKATSPGRIVAELGFAYWVGLVANYYDGTLWRPHLCHAFRPRPGRKDLHDKLEHLRTLRNRIAHHEHLLARNLNDDYQRILDVTGWLDPQLQGWINFHSRVYEAIGAPPHHICRV